MINQAPIIRKLPQKFILIARLSGGLTITLSLIYTLLSVTYYVFRYNCQAGSTASIDGGKYFWHTIFRVYILSNTCEQRLTITKLLDETTLLILVSVALAVTVVFAGVAIFLVSITQDESLAQYADKVVYAYIGCFIASLTVDITTASYFGVDYGYLSSLLAELSAGSPANYKLEVIRQGVFWLMTIALKGYVAYIINFVFVILLIVYVVEITNSSGIDEHSIHKLGALNAFEPQGNSPYVEDSTPPHTPRRPEIQRFDHLSNRSFDRSDSWHHTQNNPTQNSGRPFSYLEDLKRPMPPKPLTASPTPDTHWRRDVWSQPGPPVPAPDYSPEQPRKLKSALKPAYM